MLNRSFKRAVYSLSTRMREGLCALAAARRRRLMAFAMLDRNGLIGHRIVVSPR